MMFYHHNVIIMLSLCYVSKNCWQFDYSNHSFNGDLAQMVERPIRIRKVLGSIPGFSKVTKFWHNLCEIMFEIYAENLVNLLNDKVFAVIKWKNAKKNRKIQELKFETLISAHFLSEYVLTDLALNVKTRKVIPGFSNGSSIWRKLCELMFWIYAEKIWGLENLRTDFLKFSWKVPEYILEI